MSSVKYVNKFAYDQIDQVDLITVSNNRLIVLPCLPTERDCIHFLSALDTIDTFSLINSNLIYFNNSSQALKFHTKTYSHIKMDSEMNGKTIVVTGAGQGEQKNQIDNNVIKYNT